jgi:hypothetical protein
MNVIAEAARRGFTLDERVVAGEWVHGSARGDDDRWPCFHTESQALSWMDDQLRRTRCFDR